MIGAVSALITAADIAIAVAAVLALSQTNEFVLSLKRYRLRTNEFVLCLMLKRYRSAT